MGKVAIVLRIMPESADLDVGGLKDNIGKAVQVQNVSIEPIAFGLNAINATILVDDSEGASEAVEEKIRKVSGVGELQILEMNRV